MSDKELLELAAKAADVSLVARPEDVNDWVWNPLIDDGDALRLAVKLELDICHTPHNPLKIGVWVQQIGDFIEEERSHDPLAATRRAIVRAAAEIGKEMK